MHQSQRPKANNALHSDEQLVPVYAPRQEKVQKGGRPFYHKNCQVRVGFNHRPEQALTAVILVSRVQID
jgi:hypothetical protein